MADGRPVAVRPPPPSAAAAGPATRLRLRHSARFWRRAAAVLGVTALALLVAATIGRPAPDFSARPVIAVVRDGGHHPVWAIRLASTAHQIAADSLRPQPVPAGRAYQLWLAVAGAPALHPLGLLPQRGRKAIPVTPANTRLLAGAGDLLVTLEPTGGSKDPAPSGPVLFRGVFNGS